MTDRRLRLGRSGEDAAAEWYRNAGYTVLDRNWRCDRGELDLVVGCRGVVAFVEVKARSSSRFGTGAEAVDHRKQRRVRAVATAWLRSNGGGWDEIRFDVVDVDGRGTLQVYEGCF